MVGQLPVQRSFIIPVLDMSPHSRFNIETLLSDLEGVDGEVVCIFNSSETHERLKRHPRIDEYCFNKSNAGVSRSWNLGIHLSESETIFMMNADLHVMPKAIHQLESYLRQLPDAVLVGPQGSYMEEWDIGIQVMKAGLACYAVPVVDFEHEWGISGSSQDQPINYFGRTVYRDELLVSNRKKFLAKWFGSPG